MRAHKDEFLRYELGVEVARRAEPMSVLDDLLAGADPVLAAPVLYLEKVTREWSPEQRQTAVHEALRALGLEAPDDLHDPRAQATTACQRWAKKEAAAGSAAEATKKRQLSYPPHT